MNIILDLETIGDDSEETREAIKATIKPPANYKKQEAIDKWWDENGTAALDDAVAKTSFDGAVGHIICIGLATDNGEPTALFQGTEAKIMTDAYAFIQEAATMATKSGSQVEREITFVGHNLSGFDLRFLFHRSVVLGFKPPACLMKAMRAKPWDSCIADTMLMWSPDRDKRISLDKLCKALGIQTPKGDLDGSKVWDYYRDGRIQEIADYCKKDIVATREVYKRLVFA